MLTGLPSISRTEQRGRGYRRAMVRACVWSAVLHLLAAVAVNPTSVLRYFVPEVQLGFAGRSHRGELGPTGEIRGKKAALVPTQRLGRGVMLPRIAILRSSDPSGAVAAAPTSSRGVPVPVAVPVAGASGAQGGTGESPVVELDENWAPVSGVGNPARSRRFQIAKIVRPDYPPMAVRAGHEGVVRVKASVDTLGRVSEVQTVLNATPSRALEEASLEALRDWEFLPYRPASQAIPFVVVVPFRYRLIQ